MTHKTFEQFLQEKHAELFPTLLDDDMPDHFDDWLGTLDGEDYMRYAEEAVREAFLAGYDHAAKVALEALKH